MTKDNAFFSSQLLFRLKQRLVQYPNLSVGILGMSEGALDVLSALRAWGGEATGIYIDASCAQSGSLPLKSVEALKQDAPGIVVVAGDENKEELLLSARDLLLPNTQIVIGGSAHYDFRDEIFVRVRDSLLVPSFANGYPNCLTHIFQCLKNAARLQLNGSVVEFGMFKGGTTMFMSRVIEELAMPWPVIGFDSFDGFPPPRSALDMYSHGDCEFKDESSVRRYFEGRNVKIVAGDVVETVRELVGEDVVLAFVDTDNYTSASAILGVVADCVLPGGAIIFDHYPGSDRFLYTLGERMAAKSLLNDKRFFNLHGTGVFMRTGKVR